MDAVVESEKAYIFISVCCTVRVHHQTRRNTPHCTQLCINEYVMNIEYMLIIIIYGSMPLYVRHIYTE